MAVFKCPQLPSVYLFKLVLFLFLVVQGLSKLRVFGNKSLNFILIYMDESPLCPLTPSLLLVASHLVEYISLDFMFFPHNNLFQIYICLKPKSLKT